MEKLILNSEIIEPKSGNVSKAIILFHGYGGDGKDISVLSNIWSRYLKNTIFICPDGHEKCDINPNGYQWFDLSKDDPNYILEQILIAEKKINNFINQIKYNYHLKNEDICLSGFSQGCMISLNVGLTSKENFNSIIGFSGKIINKEDLSNRLKNKTNVLLFHGNLDTIVPPNNLLDAKDFLIRHKIRVQSKMIQNCDHTIPVEASSNALDYLKKNLENN